MNPSALNPSIFDVNGLAALKRPLKSGDKDALKAAAQQFEALFLQMVLKSMREASPREGLFDSEQTRLYESLLDQQMGQVLSRQGGMGLAALIERQLSRSSDEPTAFEGGLPLNPATRMYPLAPPTRALPLPAVDGARPAAVPAPAPALPAAATPPSAGAQDFVDRVWPHAQDAGRATGIPASFLVAQAALETGWGRSEPRRADGSPSHNLFGIKAGRSWSGPVVEATTSEYIDGQTQPRVERFRAYGSYAEAFRDYANLLLESPRYAAVVGTSDAASFARGLQRAGYASDPLYAAKLERIIGGQTLKAALAS